LGEFRDYRSLDFDFTMPRANSVPARVYVGRLVKTENYIYWLYYSNVMLFDDEPELESRHFGNAEAFFKGISFEDEIKK